MDIENKVEIHLGNCLDVMREIPTGSVDMILCDLPYAVTKLKWDVLIPFDDLWEQYNRVCKNNAAVVLFGAEPFSSKLRLSNLDNFKYDWYWHKNKPTGGALATKQPMRCFETLSVFYRQQPTYNPLMGVRTEIELSRLSKHSETKCDSEMYGASGYTQIRDNLKQKFPTNYLNFKTVHSRDSQKTKHPTQKPVELLEYLVKTYTNQGEVVLDNCMGSGSTAIACLNTQRSFVGIELDSGYFNIAKARINCSPNAYNIC